MKSVSSAATPTKTLSPVEFLENVAQLIVHWPLYQKYGFTGGFRQLKASPLVSAALPPSVPDNAGRSIAPCSPPAPPGLATRRAAALSQASPTASSNRLLKGALLGSCATFSVFTPQSGQRTRYSSITTVVRYSKHGRSRISRSQTSAISLTPRPQPEHTSFRSPDLRRTHSLSVFASSLISLRYTR